LLLSANPGTIFADDDLNLYEWAAIAPIVVAGESLGDDGAYTELAVSQVFRGHVSAEEVLRLNRREANRSRSYSVDEKPLQLDRGHSFVVLLKPSVSRKTGKRASYSIVRGVHGARELPAEGTVAFLGALRRFIEIQDSKNELLKWQYLDDMLEDTNPILIGTALDQFIKFRRGTPAALPSLRPLLEHPDESVRARAAEAMDFLE